MDGQNWQDETGFYLKSSNFGFERNSQCVAWVSRVGVDQRMAYIGDHYGAGYEDIGTEGAAGRAQ